MADVQDATAEPSMEEILASIRKIIADEKEPVPDADEAMADDVLELTQMVQDDGSVVDLAAGGPVFPEQPTPLPEPASPPAPQELPPMPEPPPVAPPAKANGMDDELVSSRAASSASSSLAALANTIQVERMATTMPGMTPLGDGSKTLEDMVMALMRPMLKSWLDENLPTVVERLVQKEVERIARRAAE